MVKVGEEIEVKILRVDADERKIGLSRKRVEWAEEEAAETPAETGKRGARPATAELRGGTGSGSGQLFTMPKGEKKETGSETAEGSS